MASRNFHRCFLLETFIRVIDSDATINWSVFPERHGLLCYVCAEVCFFFKAVLTLYPNKITGLLYGLHF